MKESEAKNKICPQLMAASIVSSTSVIDIEPLEKLISCKGSGCVMWELEYKKEEKEIKVGAAFTKSDVLEQIPEGWFLGNYWLSQRVNNEPTDATAKIYRWIPIDSGDCGLKTKESGCRY